VRTRNGGIEMKRTSVAAVVVFAAAATVACQPLHPVGSAAEATEIAKQVLGKESLARGPLQVTRDGRRWLVKTQPHDGLDGDVAVIDARTGLSAIYTAEVVDVSIVKPAKK